MCRCHRSQRKSLSVVAHDQGAPSTTLLCDARHGIRICRQSCAPTTCEASGPGAGECGRGGETLAEPAGCRPPKLQVRRPGSSSDRDQRTVSPKGWEEIKVAVRGRSRYGAVVVTRTSAARDSLAGYGYLSQRLRASLL